MVKPLKFAYFVTPHGYGHAARACAVMAALAEREPSIRFEIFTRTPPWFFEEAVPGLFNYHPFTTDIGLVQKTALQEDLPETVRELNEYLPFKRETLLLLAEKIKEVNCRAVICDISPLGIAAAREAGIPSILIENFTWDWIYEGYYDQEPGLTAPSRKLGDIFKTAVIHIQTEPVCSPATCSLTVPPVSRKPRATRAETRCRLGIPEGSRVVLVTMGGIHGNYHSIDRLKTRPGVSIVIPGGSDVEERRDGLILLPHHSTYFHPDLVAAADAIIGKTGYSTVAETYHAGIPFGFVSRPNFRESAVLGHFIRTELGGIEISPETLSRGKWIDILPELFEIPLPGEREPNGAVRIAEYIQEYYLL